MIQSEHEGIQNAWFRSSGPNIKIIPNEEVFIPEEIHHEEDLDDSDLEET